MRCYPALSLAALALAGCSRPPPAADPDLTAEIQRIRAIDNHAHPVRVTQPGEPADRFFDALPVDNMEPQSDPVNLRPNAPSIADAWRALYGAGRVDQQRKQAVMQQKGDAYPEWVLDQMGVEVMLANRVSMGPTIQPPRFRWVPYADALIFPLDNSKLAAVNSDRKSFFALEDKLRAALSARRRTRRAPRDSHRISFARSHCRRSKSNARAAPSPRSSKPPTCARWRSTKWTAPRRERLYAAKSTANQPADYKALQDFLFRYIAAECGRLGMAVHIHTEAGAGGYFDVAGANPLNLESVLDDPDLRKTKFVMLHGGWPFIGEITALLTKPNAYLDFSAQDLARTPDALAAYPARMARVRS